MGNKVNPSGQLVLNFSELPRNIKNVITAMSVYESNDSKQGLSIEDFSIARSKLYSMENWFFGPREAKKTFDFYKNLSILWNYFKYSPSEKHRKFVSELLNKMQKLDNDLYWNRCNEAPWYKQLAGTPPSWVRDMTKMMTETTKQINGVRILTDNGILMSIDPRIPISSGREERLKFAALENNGKTQKIIVSGYQNGKPVEKNIELRINGLPLREINIVDAGQPKLTAVYYNDNNSARKEISIINNLDFCQTI